MEAESHINPDWLREGRVFFRDLLSLHHKDVKMLRWGRLFKCIFSPAAA